MNSKGALGLLSTYGDSSSEDEVPLGRVSVKRSHKSDSEDEINCVKLKLPVPRSIFNTTSNTIEVHEDNSDLHSGRTRSFPHERGNWVSYVYITYPQNHQISSITRLISEICPSIEFKANDDLHISLTKTFVLKYHWIEAFVKSVQENMCLINRFVVMFQGIKIYCNEERSRTFIGLEIKTGMDSLLKLVELLDSCLEEFKLPKFYEDPSFHMSIMWCLGDYELELNKVIDRINEEYLKILEEHDYLYIYVNFISFKSGNKLYNFNLK